MRRRVAYSVVDMKELQDKINLTEGFHWREGSPVWGRYTLVLGGKEEPRMGWRPTGELS